MRHIHNASIVELTVRLQQRNQHGIFAVFFITILIQLLKEILVFLLRRRCITLILHFEHDGNDLNIILAHIAEDIVPLTAHTGIIVLLKISLRESRRPDAVKLRLAVSLQSFTNHLRRHARLHILETLNRIITVLDLRLILIFQSILRYTFLHCCLLKVVL